MTFHSRQKEFVNTAAVANSWEPLGACVFKVRVIKGCFVGHIKGKQSKCERMGNNEESSPYVQLIKSMLTSWRPVLLIWVAVCLDLCLNFHCQPTAD